MREIHQHPDGLIYVRADDATYVDSGANFALDFGVSLSALPDGADDHIYTQGKRHAFMGDGNVIEGGPMPWEQGDRIIENVGKALAAQEARQALMAAEVAAATPPQRRRRLVPKSLIVSRLNAVGKLVAASAALSADLYARERWYAPDKPAVYADDEEVLALLKAIGADPAVILAE